MNTPYAVNQVSLDICPAERPKRIQFAFDISDGVMPVLFADLGERGNPLAQPNIILRPEPGVVSYGWTDVLGYREMARLSGVIASAYASKVLNHQKAEALDNAIRIGWQNIAIMCSVSNSGIPRGLSSTLRVGPTTKTITFGFDVPLQSDTANRTWPELLGGLGREPLPVRASRKIAPFRCAKHLEDQRTYVWDGTPAGYELVRVTNTLAQMFAHVGHPDQMNSAVTRLALDEAWLYLAMRFQ
jgi:hypothetical protein